MPSYYYIYIVNVENEGMISQGRPRRESNDPICKNQIIRDAFKKQKHSLMLLIFKITVRHILDTYTRLVASNDY